MADFGRLDGLLQGAAKLLDLAATEICDLGFDKETNIRKVGQVLAEIFELQIEIYERRPDLRPDHLEPVRRTDQVQAPTPAEVRGAVGRELAERTISEAVQCSRRLEAILFEIQNECTEEEFLKYRRGFAYVLGYLYTDVMRPLIQQYPELTPPGLKQGDRG